MREIIARFDDGNEKPFYYGEEVGEIIRCKDCKHFDRNEIGRAEGGIYNICSEGRGMFLKENDFCSSAERKEE